MIGRLEKEGYVETKHYKGARLTKEGLDRTLDIIKRHRLLELFLIEILQQLGKRCIKRQKFLNTEFLICLWNA